MLQHTLFNLSYYLNLIRFWEAIQHEHKLGQNYKKIGHRSNWKRYAEEIIIQVSSKNILKFGLGNFTIKSS